MSQNRSLLLFLSLFLAGGTLLAQSTTTNLDSFKLTFTPPPGTILVSESTNLLAITITNLMNVTQVDTNQVTNFVFTNVTVSVNFVLGTNTNTLSLRDD